MAAFGVFPAVHTFKSTQSLRTETTRTADLYKVKAGLYWTLWAVNTHANTHTDATFLYICEQAQGYLVRPDQIRYTAEKSKPM